MTPRTPRRVVLLAYDEMNLLDLCGPLQALATAGRRAAGNGANAYETIVASVNGGLITTSAGLPVMTVALSALETVAIDTLIVPGGCKGDEFHAPPRLVAWIAQRAPTVRRLCSVCTGAFLLAAAGQLDGKRAATHWDWVGRLEARHPAIRVDADKIFVRDGSIWTSAGVSAGIDLTLALIEEDFGHQVAIDTARQLVMFIKRSGGQSQFSVPLAAQAHDDARFTDLHAWIAAHLTGDLCVERLAEIAGMSPRTFARVYAERMGRTPAKTVEAMRLEAACRALEETDLPLKAIAVATGHAEEQNLRRAFQRQLGITPTQYRERFSAHG
ncbi:GlxA family transcriptional regulator [Montanilutibacter psychrotolerans]|uniref:GlxA family transcriptional regulator n=1 Tax=Montanilutibacter psychrotolerans TaxID=1327343 RepID=A0A3M8T424_9GAMM|nr:GlxA family transcriptional regulator [Lysobacter psychrotolerans]RNF86224.1 GlxA family transcriptional regulator [Lysobacter psychrotolerans]